MSALGGERSESGAFVAGKPRFERPALRLVASRPLRVVDVATWYGERSGGIRTYLDAKSAFARRTGAFDHRLVVPGVTRRVTDHTCSLPSIRVATSNGYRWPLGTRPLVDLLRELEPDVVLLHDPFWDPRADRGRAATLPLRFGLDAAAASGAATVACTTAPSARLLGDLVHTFEPGDPLALLAAIERARVARPDRLRVARFAAANRWERAFAAELADLEALVS